MKFFKFETKVTEKELDIIKSNLTDEQYKKAIIVTSDLKYVDFLNEDGFFGSFLIINEEKFEELFNFYKSFLKDLKIKDLSTEILLGRKIKTDYIEFNGNNETHILDLIKEYYQENVKINDILDKIYESGIESLTEFDKEVLAKG